MSLFSFTICPNRLPNSKLAVYKFMIDWPLFGCHGVIKFQKNPQYFTNVKKIFLCIFV